MSTAATATPFCVKWGKQVLEFTFDVTQANSGDALREHLSLKSGVPTSRMKVMSKTKGLWRGIMPSGFVFPVDSNNDPNVKVVNLLMMGTADASALKEPVKKAVFVEDLQEHEIAKVGAAEPPGLTNLGNTCYLNSVTQCLNGVPELGDEVVKYAGNNSMVLGLKSTFMQLKSSTDAVKPMSLVMATKSSYPQFAQTTPQGHPMQCDAEEYLSCLLDTAARDEARDLSKKVKDLFTIQFEEKLSLKHGEEQMEETKKYDQGMKLVCNIQGYSSTNNVTEVSEGIKLSLGGTITKRSEVTGQDEVFQRDSKISKLPPVLVVQFGRFYWKATPNSRDHTGVKCKVMKPVGFSHTLDLFNFCADNIQSKIQALREQHLKEEEERDAKRLRGEDVEETIESKVESQDGDVSMEDEDAELQAALAMSMKPDLEQVDEKNLPYGFMGCYELFAVVTHKGRDADGGHYMGWVKADTSNVAEGSSGNENDDWYVFDDDEVSPCKLEDIVKLKGGGDWHMSYLNFYRAKKGM